MTNSGSSRSGFMPARVVHLHPSRFCNLSCKHCYSASGPGLRDQLAAEVIVSALPALKMEGYEILSFSGGEPLLYPGFKEVVRRAAALGFEINLITNGAPVGGHILDFIAEYVSLVAVSLDGAPSAHIELRGDTQAFVRAERAIDRLAAKDLNFGIAYCVSRESLVDMPWAFEFARSKGAALIQFHPFAPTGRGRQLADRLSLNEVDKARAYVVSALLDNGEAPVTQIDLASVEAARARQQDYTLLNPTDISNMLLSELINPLIIDEKGLVSPFCYGIHPQFAIGQLRSTIPALANDFRKKGWHDVTSLLNAAFTRLGKKGERFVDWFYHIVDTSYSLQIDSERMVAFEAGALPVVRS